MPEVFTFSPYIFSDSRLLILGSAPSVRSLAAGFYYGHPQNRFWPLLAMLCGETPPETWEARKALARRHGVALWDVIERCEREGSTDARIRNPVLSDVPALLSHHPGIGAVALNGSLAAKLFATHGPLPGVHVYPLPSTSPIPRRDIRCIGDLYARWQVLLPWLTPEGNTCSR
ncbi:MAG: DNA-deoxyinosine glycosylase [Clostridiaceae bacterium]|nr:DNA-deoxyinosine glycosylase [Clostridiaceae bacterium]